MDFIKLSQSEHKTDNPHGPAVQRESSPQEQSLDTSSMPPLQFPGTPTLSLKHSRHQGQSASENENCEAEVHVTLKNAKQLSVITEEF